ncbi:hypothetical protein ACS3SW_01610 [Roseobacteraceae bacterium S113]
MTNRGRMLRILTLLVLICTAPLVWAAESTRDVRTSSTAQLITAEAGVAHWRAHNQRRPQDRYGTRLEDLLAQPRRSRPAA